MPAEYTCTKCNGSGKESCHGCCGRGWHRNEEGIRAVNDPFGRSKFNLGSAPEATQSQRKDCFRCHGSGTIDCVECSGSGRCGGPIYKECFECRGSGTLGNPIYGPPLYTCPKCSGSGRILIQD